MKQSIKITICLGHKQLDESVEKLDEETIKSSIVQAMINSASNQINVRKRRETLLGHDVSCIVIVNCFTTMCFKVITWHRI